jgi:hypothetical protein
MADSTLTDLLTPVELECALATLADFVIGGYADGEDLSAAQQEVCAKVAAARAANLADM